MKERFPSDRRSAWRERFLAIARETGSVASRRDSLDAGEGVRGRFLPPRAWRGVRLSCRA